MWFTTRSRKYRSWVTITRPPLNRRSQSSSQATISLSRWLVGSSRISTSAGWIRAAARATRFRWPPERVPTFWAKSVMPSRFSMALASYSFRARNAAGKWRNTCSSTVASSSITGFWGSRLIWTLGFREMVPPSGSVTPESTFKKVDLPVPLMPMTPTLSPSLR